MMGMTPPKFVVDAMLGRTARELRLLGYDVLFDPTWDDARLLRTARGEGRVLLTRDRALWERARGLARLFVEPEAPRRQAAWIAARLGFDPVRDGARPFSRCLRCGGALARVSREAAAPFLPDHVLHAHDHFLLCGGCGRAYWEGGHRPGLGRRLAEILAEMRAEAGTSGPAPDC
jgi:uncharacterized protein with PIN domain